MPNILVILFASFMLTSSFMLGVIYRRIHDLLLRIDKDINELKHKEEIQNESAIVETTPQIIREKVRKGEEPDEDSAIVTTKSPQEIRQAKEAQLNKELDRLGR